jgi:hypothetical protein
LGVQDGIVADNASLADGQLVGSPDFCLVVNHHLRLNVSPEHSVKGAPQGQRGYLAYVDNDIPGDTLSGYFLKEQAWCGQKFPDCSFVLSELKQQGNPRKRYNNNNPL